MLLWNFGRGSQTPLQFYLTNELHASDSVFSYFYGIFTLAFIPTIFVYGFLCKKVPLEQAAVVGNGDRDTADDSDSAYSHAEPRACIGSADRDNGRHSHCCLFRSGVLTVLSARPPGYR